MLMIADTLLKYTLGLLDGFEKTCVNCKRI